MVIATIVISLLKDYIICINNIAHNYLRYDYNEPSKGKDQCDRESATAKALLKNYVDAGNDLANAKDIYSGLHYASRVANAKVAVVDTDKKNR